jgi:NAD(P)H-nitrite reductase large subunit
MTNFTSDVGGSQYIIDGKIKLKNDSQIQGFTPDGLKFEDGSELEADVVLFSTGFVCLFENSSSS